jgi:porphobilinogen synthase
MIVRAYPQTRMRRLRKHPWLRRLTQEHQVQTSDLILPIFVHDEAQSQSIASLPGVSRHSIDNCVRLCEQACALGITAVALFPAVASDKKDALGSEALRDDNLIARTIVAIRERRLDLGIICDCALDPYTDHSHDGVLQTDGDVDNDATIIQLTKQALALANAGADVIAPSDMMDGRIGAIRQALDSAGHQSVSILSYTAKYASRFYGPFRDAVGADGLTQARYPHQKSNKKTYQMHPANRLEARHIALQHLHEGADCLMVKPAMNYLDVVLDLVQETQAPVFAYQVSGEYAMLVHYAERMQLPIAEVLQESLLACKRAGARAVLTYGALDVAHALTTSTIDC